MDAILDSLNSLKIFVSIHPIIISVIVGPKMCTTLAKEGNKSGPAECGRMDNATGEFIEGSVWHSCEEWCLSKVNCYAAFIV